MKKALFNIRLIIFSFLKILLSWWRKPLNRETTVELLQENVVYKQISPSIDAPPYISSIDKKTKLRLDVFGNDLKENTIDFEPDYVWQISRNERFSDLQICSSGSPLINKKLILDLDYGTVGAYKEFPIKFKVINYDLVVAPWSHTFDGYYSFLLLIVTKLCRIETALGREIWQTAKICYPLFHTKYEKQYFDKLGIPDRSIIDTQQPGITIKPKTLICANNQTIISRISSHDIELLRQRFLNRENSDRHNRNNRKIYLSRRNRRILKNESEIEEILLERGFELIEDKYYTVDEQISLFNSASVIVAIHGAGLANLVWCNPGTKVIELFYSGYTKPSFYYLAKILNLEYGCLFDKNEAEDHASNKFCDLEVDAILFSKLLNIML